MAISSVDDVGDNGVLSGGLVDPLLVAFGVDTVDAADAADAPDAADADALLVAMLLVSVYKKNVNIRTCRFRTWSLETGHCNR